MKGVVFTEFLEMVEDHFSMEVADRIIEASDLPSEGAYTSIGTYDHAEMVQLVTNLSQETDIPIPDLLCTFGKYLFGHFAAGYPQFFEGIEGAFPFIEKIDGYIHVEVRKLYPDAELPTFKCDTSKAGRLTVIYNSTRPFADLAKGLLMGCLEHFGEKADLQHEDLSNEQGTSARFTLTKQE